MIIRHNSTVVCDGCTNRAIGYTLKELRGMGWSVKRGTHYCEACK